jgi:hypothetical protein
MSKADRSAFVTQATSIGAHTIDGAGVVHDQVWEALVAPVGDRQRRC